MKNWRWLVFNCIPALALALCGTTAFLWCRSDRISDWLTWQWAGQAHLPYHHTRLSALSTRGLLVFRLEFVRGANPLDAENEQWLWNLHREDGSGLQITHSDSNEPWVNDDDQGVIDKRIGSIPDVITKAAVLPVPYYVVFAATAAPMAWFLFALLRRGLAKADYPA